ncbi:MAG: hypothetical protein ABI611_02345 [Solirubrobacteraceae bacterium]
MLEPTLTLLVAPALVGAATLAARRWGQRPRQRLPAETTRATRPAPNVGRILAALPVLASILAVFKLAQRGGAALQDLLRGTAAFIVFCAPSAALVQPAGIAIAFAAAVLGALAAQAGALRLTARGIPLAT